MRLTITIDMDNAAFDFDLASEAGRILHVLASHIEEENPIEEGWEKPIMDCNGNHVGQAVVQEKPSEGAHDDLVAALKRLVADYRPSCPKSREFRQHQPETCSCCNARAMLAKAEKEG